MILKICYSCATSLLLGLGFWLRQEDIVLFTLGGSPLRGFQVAEEAILIAHSCQMDVVLAFGLIGFLEDLILEALLKHLMIGVESAQACLCPMFIWQLPLV